MERLAVIRELFEMVRQRRSYWMLPTVLALVLVGAIIVATESSTIAPFLYPLF